jgi:hypothetical protein
MLMKRKALLRIEVTSDEWRVIRNGKTQGRKDGEIFRNAQDDSVRGARRPVSIGAERARLNVKQAFTLDRRR